MTTPAQSENIGVTAAAGFRAAGVTAGLKQSGKPDLALVVNDGPIRAAAAVTTSNRVFAAPVKWTRQSVAGGGIDAVVLNSGGANACTGIPGYADTVATAEYVAAALGTESKRVAVCSTGLIGERLNMKEGTVRQRYRRALGVLKDVINAERREDRS